LHYNLGDNSKKSVCTHNQYLDSLGGVTTAAGTKTFTLSSVDARVSSFPFVRARELDINYDNFFLAFLVIIGRAGFVDSISRQFFFQIMFFFTRGTTVWNIIFNPF